jgi:YQGE family putative transporter
VIIYQLCVSVSRPLLDAAYFPIQMRVIDHIAAIERRSKFAYIFHHEYGLYFGRLLGCVLFLVGAKIFSPEFVLRYLLVAIAVLQAVSLPVAAVLLRKFAAPSPAGAVPAAILTTNANLA